MFSFHYQKLGQLDKMSSDIMLSSVLLPQRIWDALLSSCLSWANPNLGVCIMEGQVGSSQIY